MAPIAHLQQWWQEVHGIFPSSFLLPLLLMLFSFLFVFKLIRNDKLNLPPSPPKLPLIGNLHQLGTLPHQSLQALSMKYGPLMLLRLGIAPTLVVSSAKIAQEIMKTHDIVFANKFRSTAAEIVFYGCTDVAFSPYGEYWKQAKKICVLELLSLKRVQSFQLLREEEVDDLIEKIQGVCLNGDAINLGEMFITISNNIVCRSAIGKKMEGGDGRFGELSRRVVELFGAFCFEDFFPLGWILDVLSGLTTKLKESSKELHAYLDEVIKEHQILKGDENHSDEKDFVDIFLQLQRDGKLGINLTQDNLKAILLDMFLGGTDTSSTTLEWAMAELVKNPSKMKKAQEEVRRVVGKKSKVHEADLTQMNYLKCIIKEILRLYPPAPFLVPRESSASHVKLEGYDIPPKTRVFINVWAIQRDSEFWDRPEEFLPERFIDNPVDFKGHNFQFIPFGSGRRSCPGMSYAMVAVEYVLANILYWFDWKLPPGATVENFDMTEAYGLVVHKKIPLQLVPVFHSP